MSSCGRRTQRLFRLRSEAGLRGWAVRSRRGQRPLGVAAAQDCWNELFGEKEFVDESGRAVDLGELAFFLIGARGHGDDVTDGAEKSNFYRERIVTGEVVEIEIEQQDVRSVFDGEMQRVFQVRGNSDDVSGAFALKQMRDELANGRAVVGDQNAN